jgi:hypothetical protein
MSSLIEMKRPALAEGFRSDSELAAMKAAVDVPIALLPRVGMVMIPHISQLILLIASTVNLNCTGAGYLAILLMYALCQLGGVSHSPWPLGLLFSQICVIGLLLDATTTIWYVCLALLEPSLEPQLRVQQSCLPGRYG